MKQIKSSLTLMAVIISFFSMFFFISPAAYAVTCDDGTTEIPVNVQTDSPEAQNQFCADRGSSYTLRKIQISPASEGESCSGGECIEKDLQLALNLLAGAVGIAVTIVFVVAGIQYGTSRDNPQAVQAAKKKIYNAVIALVSFVFIYALLQFIVPGGVFR